MEHTATDEPAAAEPAAEPAWKTLRLSLERPYTNDHGRPIPTLLDITPEGEHIYEPKPNLIENVGENLRRIFLERGHDFFDRKPDGLSSSDPVPSDDDDDDDDNEQTPDSTQTMTPEELLKMRMELIPQLHIAFGEMSQARDLLSLLLADTSPDPSPFPDLPKSALVSSTVTKPPPITSVQAFNAQLVVGGKDIALRKASTLFKSAAEKMEKSRLRGEKYWLEALNIRKGNWGLVPAPLPFGSATGKGADKTAKDFLVSFGLEESPPIFKRRAIGRISALEDKNGALEFPLRQRTRLQVALTTTDSNGVRHTAQNTAASYDDDSLQDSLRAAQAEVVEQEIFTMLIKEASNLPTASARVSERLIVIEAAQATELRFELIDSSLEYATSQYDSDIDSATCDLIAQALRILLLRAHALFKRRRLARDGSTQSLAPMQHPPLLRPIVDILQYQVFCSRVRAEFDRTVVLLRQASIPVDLRFNSVSESGEELAALIRQETPRPVGGEALLRIDDRQTLRFTFLSPSSLIAHLAQATLHIASITQLSQLLADEVSGCIMSRIRDVGTEYTENAGGTWFVDLLGGRVVGRWENCVLTFRVNYTERAISCTASRLNRAGGSTKEFTDTYSSDSSRDMNFLTWIRRTVEGALL